MIVKAPPNPLQFKVCPQCKQMRDIRTFARTDTVEICICCQQGTTPQYIADPQ